MRYKLQDDDDDSSQKNNVLRCGHNPIRFERVLKNILRWITRVFTVWQFRVIFLR